MTPFEDAPFMPFHRRVAISGAGGQFSDGYSLGIIAIALDLAKGPLGLTSWWAGAIGAASLFGLFVGSLVSGSLADRFGRRPVFIWGMLFFALISVLQFTAGSAAALFGWRLLLGVALGADYVSCKALISEFSPTARRGQLLSVMGIAWGAGYLCSFLAGYLVQENVPGAWRIILLTTAAPAFVTFLLRLGTPESPQWLARKGRTGEAAAIIAKHFGPGISLPAVTELTSTPSTEDASRLFHAPLFRNLIVACVFHTAQVIPYFALSTFLPSILAQLGVKDVYFGTVIYNILMMIGAVAGWFIIDRLPRRALLIQGFVVTAGLLAVMIVWRQAPTQITVTLFAVLGLVMSAVGILQFVYPPELFPTELRARGSGYEIACSRIGSAVSTFLLPVVVSVYGVYAALGACMAISLAAAAVCQAWAPETLRKRLE